MSLILNMSASELCDEASHRDVGAVSGDLPVEAVQEARVFSQETTLFTLLYC